MFLGLDLGTTNVKALLVTPSGEIVSRGSATVRLLHTADGGIEQDMEEIWAATLSAIRESCRGADLAAVEAVGVSSQGGALQMMVARGRPLGRVVSWLDQRGVPYGAALTEKLGAVWFAEHTGHGCCALTLGQLIRLRKENAACMDPKHRVGWVGDIIVGRLCGRRAHDATSLSLAMLYNPAANRADPDLLAQLGIAPEQLPDLVSTREPAGGLTVAVSRASGLPVGIPVSAAIHDQYASALGAGVVRPGDVMFGAGTAWVILALSDRLSPPIMPSAFVCRHPVPGVYGQLLTLGNGGSAYRWALDLLGLGDRGQSQLDAMMSSVPPACEGVRFWPFLATPGEGVATETRGRFRGLELRHGPAHMLRAVEEGLVLELARYLRFLTRGGIAVERLVMTGGGARSRLTPQMAADVTGVPVACVMESEMSALGAAVIARGLTEPRAGLAELSDGMTTPARRLEPGPNATAYATLYGEYERALPMVEEAR